MKIFTLTWLIISISAIPSSTISAGGYVCGSGGTNEPILVANEYIKSKANNLSESDKQKILYQANQNKQGLERAERECQVGKDIAPMKAIRVEEQTERQKIKLQEVANRLVNSLKSNKDFDIQVMEVYELGEFGKDVGLALNSTPSPNIPMTVKYDKDKIAKIDLVKINLEAEQAKLDMPRLSQEVKNIEKRVDENTKIIDSNYDMNKLYRSDSPWYLPITDFFNNIFSSISRIFSPK
jgi:hypothetical protein